jgi:hypothetical protein
MLLEVVGIFVKNTIFWIISLLIYFIAILMLSSVIYQPGKWSLSHMTLVHMYNSFFEKAKNGNFQSSTIVSRKRVIFVTILNFINIVFLIFGALTKPNISTYLLMIFIGNLIVYFFYYFTMKLIFREKIPWQVFALGIISLGCWIPAMYFYLESVKATGLSPAESRNLNSECILGDLYDTHDIWHFLSAAGLFLSYIILLILDDGISTVARDKIHIF